MFQGCRKLNQTITIGDQTPDTTATVWNGTKWNINIPSVISATQIFYEALIFNNGDTDNYGNKPMKFNTSEKLININNLFWSQAGPMTKFNQELIFRDLTGLSEIQLLISSCTIFNNGDVSGNATGEKPLTLRTSSKLTSLVITFGSLPVFNQTVNITNISNVINLDRMFYGSTIFNNGHPAGNTSNRLFHQQKPNNISSSSFSVIYPFCNQILIEGNLPQWIAYNGNMFSIV